MSTETHCLTITKDGEDVISDEVAKNGAHTLRVAVDRGNGDVYLEFSSRRALYDFARSLLHNAVFGGGGQKEFYPLLVDGKELIVEGARLVEGSSRMFVSYPNDLERDR